MKKRVFILRDDTFRKNLANFLELLDLEKAVKVTIEDYKPQRSHSQNALYWVWMTQVADETGYTKKEAHAVFAREFLAPVVVTFGGRTSEEPRSTTTLTKVEFSEYLERVQVFCAQELSLMLPWPDEWAA